MYLDTVTRFMWLDILQHCLGASIPFHIEYRTWLYICLKKQIDNPISSSALLASKYSSPFGPTIFGKIDVEGINRILAKQL